MKRITAFIFSIILTFLILPVSAFAVSGAMGLTVSSNTIRAGETVKITLKITATEVTGLSGNINYNPNQLSYQSNSAIIGSPCTVSVNDVGNGKLKILIMDESASNLIKTGNLVSITFKVGSINPGTNVAVTTSEMILANASGTTKANASNSSLTLAVSEPLSGNAYLKSLSVKEATISPAFKNSVYDYSVSVPFETAKLTVTAPAEDSTSKVVISDTNLTAGATKNITITVTAQTGAKKTYTIKATRAKDPNYKESDNADLAEIKPSVGILSPVFKAEVLDYVIYLPYETEEIKFTAKKADTGAKEPTIEGPAKLLVGENSFKINGVSESNKTKVYSVKVIRAAIYDPNMSSSSQSIEVSSTSSQTVITPPQGFKLFSKTGFIIIGITAFHIILLSFIAVIFFKAKKGKRAK